MSAVKLYWEYCCDEAPEFGATPPVDTYLELSKPNKSGLLSCKDFLSKKRKIETGYVVEPNDCPAILSINNYGFMFKCPGNISVRLNNYYIKERIITTEQSVHGYHEIHGQYCPYSDSQKIASWISGSKYTKIHTGIVVYFPKEYLLYQGSIPQGNEKNRQNFVVWGGLESFNKERSIKINDLEYGKADMNFIVSPILNKDTFEIEKGETIGITYPALKKNKFTIEKLNHSR